MIRIHPLPSLLLVLAGASMPGLCAVEGQGYIADLRLVGALAPKTDSIDITYSPGTPATRETIGGLDPGLRLEAGITWSFSKLKKGGNFILGLSFVHSSQGNSKDESRIPQVLRMGPVKMAVLAGNISFGYALPVTPRLHIEGAPFFGIGNAQISDRGPDVAGGTYEDTGHGQYREYGARVAAYYTFPDGPQFGLGLGYLASHGEGRAAFNFVGGGHQDEDLEIDQKGVMPYLSVGLRF